MAACTQYSNIIVSGAGSSNIDGTYVPSGTTAGFTNFVITGGALGQIIQIDDQDKQWKIRRNPFPGAGFTAPYYVTQAFASLELIPSCPSDPTLVWIIFGANGSNPVPTVTGTPVAPAGPDCSNLQNRCAYAAGAESGLSRFRRLRSLGYV